MNARTMGLSALGIALLAAAWLVSLVYGARGVIVTVLIYSVPLVFLLAGVHLVTGRNREARQLLGLGYQRELRVGNLHIIHSHHDAWLGAQGKEIAIAGKLFCAGCYGLVLGTLVGDLIALRYLAEGLDRSTAIWVGVMLPLLFIPVIARYSIHRRMPAPARVASNASLALACWLLLLVVDALAHSRAMNIAVFFGFALVAVARQMAASRENATLVAKPMIVRS